MHEIIRADASAAIDTSSEPSQDTTDSVSVQVASVDEESTDDQAESELASAVAGASIGAVQRYLNWNEASQAITWVKRVCGALVICGGGYLIYLAI